MRRQSLVNKGIGAFLMIVGEETCKELGLNMTTAFTIFAKKMSREHRIPFEVSIDQSYSASNIEVIKESINQIERGKVVVKTVEELE